MIMLCSFYVFHSDILTIFKVRMCSFICIGTTFYSTTYREGACIYSLYIQYYH